MSIFKRIKKLNASVPVKRALAHPIWMHGASCETCPNRCIEHWDNYYGSYDSNGNPLNTMYCGLNSAVIESNFTPPAGCPRILDIIRSYGKDNLIIRTKGDQP